MKKIKALIVTLLGTLMLCIVALPAEAQTWDQNQRDARTNRYDNYNRGGQYGRSRDNQSENGRWDNQRWDNHRGQNRGWDNRSFENRGWNNRDDRYDYQRNNQDRYQG